MAQSISSSSVLRMSLPSSHKALRSSPSSSISDNVPCNDSSIETALATEVSSAARAPASESGMTWGRAAMQKDLRITSAWNGADCLTTDVGAKPISEGGNSITNSPPRSHSACADRGCR